MNGKAKWQAVCVMVIGFACSYMTNALGPSEFMANTPEAALALLITALVVYSILGETK